MKLEWVEPITGAAVVGVGLAFLLDCLPLLLVNRQGVPLRQWSTRRGWGWAWAFGLTFVVFFVASASAANAIEDRDAAIMTRHLDARYGHHFVYHHVGRSPMFWTIDGLPAACQPYGDLPDDPYMDCVGLTLKTTGRR